MTSTVNRPTNGHRPDVTVGDGVRVCVRAPETTATAPDRADSGQDSAFTPVHTRAVPQEPDSRPPVRPSKIRNFASTHVGDAKTAAAQSWFGRERPPALYDTAGDVFPAKGTARNPVVWVGLTVAGLLSLTGLAVAYLFAFCVATRIRASATTVLIAAAVCAHHYLP